MGFQSSQRGEWLPNRRGGDGRKGRARKEKKKSVGSARTTLETVLIKVARPRKRESEREHGLNGNEQEREETALSKRRAS